MEMYILYLILGAILLFLGAEFLVRGSSNLALKMRISPLVVGLTVVAYGTSTPELVTSINAALMGENDVAIGNVVGSNIFNILGILGPVAIISPTLVSRRILIWDLPLMIMISVMLFLFSTDLQITKIESLFLLIGAITFTVFTIMQSRRENKNKEQEPIAQTFFSNPIVIIFSIVIGLAMLIWGSKMFVDGSIQLATNMGIDKLTIGLTVVAIGTSLPEFVTSLVAAIKKEQDIAVGNIVGSNIFNILAVIGCSGLFSNGPLIVSAQTVSFDYLVMIGVAIICVPIFYTKQIIGRVEGILFTSLYVFYTIYLYLNANSSNFLPDFNWVVGSVILPIAMVLLVIDSYKESSR